MMTLDQVRRVAMSLAEATEEPHFEYTSFQVRGKIFATAPPEGEFLHIFVPEAERETALAAEPDFLEALHWGARVAGLRILLPSAKPEVVSKLLSQAWAAKAPKKLLASWTDHPAKRSPDAPCMENAGGAAESR